MDHADLLMLESFSQKIWFNQSSHNPECFMSEHRRNCMSECRQLTSIHEDLSAHLATDIDRGINLTFCHGEDMPIFYSLRRVCPSVTKDNKREACLQLPLLIYFDGVSSEGGLNYAVQKWLNNVSGKIQDTFLIATPSRPDNHWWFLQAPQGSFQDGWTKGEFKPELVQNFLRWIATLSQQVWVDQNYVSLLGYSAGAYAVLELLAMNESIDLNFRGVIIGGVHGHGLPGQPNWLNFENRLGKLTKAPTKVFHIVHNTKDRQSVWHAASKIVDKLQEMCVRVHLDMFDSDYMDHSYFFQTFTPQKLLCLLGENYLDRVVQRYSVKCVGCSMLVNLSVDYGDFCCVCCAMQYYKFKYVTSHHGQRCQQRQAVETSIGQRINEQVIPPADYLWSQSAEAEWCQRVKPMYPLRAAASHVQSQANVARYPTQQLPDLQTNRGTSRYVALTPQQIFAVSLARESPEIRWGLTVQQRGSGGARIVNAPADHNSPAGKWNLAVVKFDLHHHAMQRDDLILSMNGRAFHVTDLFKAEVLCATLVICRDD